MRKSSSTPAGGRTYSFCSKVRSKVYLKLDSSNYPHRRAGLVGRRVGGGGAHIIFSVSQSAYVSSVNFQLWCVVNELPSGSKLGRVGW